MIRRLLLLGVGTVLTGWVLAAIAALLGVLAERLHGATQAVAELHPDEPGYRRELARAITLGQTIQLTWADGTTRLLIAEERGRIVTVRRLLLGQLARFVPMFAKPAHGAAAGGMRQP